MALLDKFSEGAAYVFLDGVLSKFGAPTKVLIDQGKEFLGEFKTLLKQTYIDHRTTSCDHSKAHGLAKYMLLTIKKVFGKYDLQ